LRLRASSPKRHSVWQIAYGAALLLGGAAIVVLTWTTLKDAIQVARDLRAVRNTVPNEITLTELLADTWFDPPPRVSRPSTILLVGRPSEAWTSALEQWRRALERPAPGLSDVQVLVSTPEPSTIENNFAVSLKAVGVSVQVLRIRDVERFRYGTGISIVPAAIVVTGGERRVRAAATGIAPAEEVQRRILHTILHPGPTSLVRSQFQGGLTLIDEASILPYEPK
jgi:hypothetical protein